MMRIRRRTWSVLALVAALAVMLAAPVGANSGGNGSGLWESDHTPAVTDCQYGSSDANGFCTIDDRDSVSLGVRFTTAKPVNVTGVRIYRVDEGAVTGTLWKADGTPLATGAFGAFSDNGWQDLTFATPVPITPGQTYVASYVAPNAKYAYEYEFFTNSGLTVGPITALSTADAGGNGVYAYSTGGGSTGYPFPTFTATALTRANTNYWVTPLWEYATPQSKDACKADGWMNYTDDEGTSFANQGDCVSYVATGGTNKAKDNASTDQLLLEAGALG